MEIRDLRRCQLTFCGIFQNCSGKRMFTFFLQGKCQGEKLLFRNIICRKQIRHLRLSAGDRTGLVQGNNLDLACFLKRDSSFEQDTVSGSHSVADHDRYRSGKSKCAWTTDNKNRNSTGK